MTDQKYYVVEFRIPYSVMEAASVDDAVFKANRKFEDDFKFIPNRWYTRVFVYENGEGVVGPSEEWFYNPQGEASRELTKNWKEHEALIKNGKK